MNSDSDLYNEDDYDRYTESRYKQRIKNRGFILR